ncbi:3-oxoacyl-[acyl-carrier-protein] reductase FabG [Fundidesulfovibrio magnetotacticus]|uniref:3-oxoacyl-[acyl-carrier-protein] reductase n=1 Tax=Fundidesulfovibrio magnetotacticus TaxID=2730080 RepID=A0A6V8M026_9BACT|nr:3-oxoacyl-[acyl-carrier-protein] reductase [Fundidesulfovibrio magnetotacticus]GFK95619.1 3-oxoacyl-[acyl-carrier-protein] reductase FabG [Fundidesulfovibrio magnetotacticus]
MKNPPRLTALVTGGSRGIGAAVSKRLAQDGFSVILTYVSKPEEAKAVAAHIMAEGGEAQALRLDVGDREAIAAFFKEHIEGKVDLDVLVNNAGITKDGLLVRMKDEDWDRVIGVNLTGAFTCLREAAKIMMKRRAGRIVNIVSVVGQTGNAGQANYVAAKAGLIGLTKTAAVELAPRGVTVNAVAPGFIESDMTSVLPEAVKENFLQQIPLKKMGTPEDVASAVSYLASPGASYVTGQVLAVNGGLHRS